MIKVSYAVCFWLQVRNTDVFPLEQFLKKYQQKKMAFSIKKGVICWGFFGDAKSLIKL